MIKRLNRLPERVQFLVILLIAPTIFAASWFHDNVMFGEPDCGSVCESQCPAGEAETVVSGALVCMSQEEYDQKRRRDANDTLREVLTESPPLTPYPQTAN